MTLSLLHVSVCLDVSVGWERTFTEVNEGVGTFQLRIFIMNPTQDVELSSQLAFFLDLQTVPGTAGIGWQECVCFCKQRSCFSNPFET